MSGTVACWLARNPRKERVAVRFPRAPNRICLWRIRINILNPSHTWIPSSHMLAQYHGSSYSPLAAANRHGFAQAGVQLGRPMKIYWTTRCSIKNCHCQGNTKPEPHAITNVVLPVELPISYWFYNSAKIKEPNSSADPNYILNFKIIFYWKNEWIYETQINC